MTPPDFGRRVVILVMLFALALAGVMWLDPIPQDPAYHAFADGRPLLGIANFGDVASNAAFILVGALGLWSVLGPARRNIFNDAADAWPYAVFFAAVGLISLGSAYYHLAPDNDRLVWDRLPMTIGFMAMFAAFIADRIDRKVGLLWLLPLLIIAGMASVAYWAWSEQAGSGDLRFYIIVQFFPMVALPVLCWLFPRARYTGGFYLIWVFAWYGAAKLFELFDGEIFALTGNMVSGHTIKHLAAAVATGVILQMLHAARRRPI
ncbi:MAG: hypothetical protein ACTSQV_02215 [Alphaproteobacteria bacterium]